MSQLKNSGICYVVVIDLNQDQLVIECGTKYHSSITVLTWEFYNSIDATIVSNTVVHCFLLFSTYVVRMGHMYQKMQMYRRDHLWRHIFIYCKISNLWT
jgi:hypothetical protein